jgi:hypothetical protein
MARFPPQSFLLRLWREQAGAPPRVTLIPVAQPQAPRHFATLEALHAFLQAEADGATEMLALDGSDCTACDAR